MQQAEPPESGQEEDAASHSDKEVSCGLVTQLQACRPGS